MIFIRSRCDRIPPRHLPLQHSSHRSALREAVLQSGEVSASLHVLSCLRIQDPYLQGSKRFLGQQSFN